MRKLPLFLMTAFAIVAGCATPSAETQSSAMMGNETDPYAAPAIPKANELPTEWAGNGSADCAQHVNADPNITKFQYDENTWLLRENKCLNFEANFIHVLFGRDKVLIQDTGSIPQDWGNGPSGREKFAQAFPIRDAIEGLITEYLAKHPNADGTPRGRETMELLVTHTHSHGDHVQGDYQFRQPDGTPFPHTQIAGLRPAEVAQFFGITDWPNKPATLDLGNRKLEVLAIPGHENSHVAIYDHGSHLLYTGDSLYPGHLFVNDWVQYRASIQRLEAFVGETNALTGEPLRPIVHVFGTHIEKTPEPAKFYPYPSWVQEPERKLELTRDHVKLLAQKVTELGPTSPHREIFLDDFAIDAQ